MEGRRDQKEQWETTYSSNSLFFGDGPSELAVSALECFRRMNTRKVLDIGCGQGRDAFFFAEQGLEVWALDYSEEAVRQLEDRTEAEGVDITMGNHDIRDPLPFPDDSFDAVYSHMLFTMELSEEEVAFGLRECLRVLRPGGLNIYSVRNENDPHYGRFQKVGEDMWQNPMGFIVHFFTEEKVRRLSEGYEIYRIAEFDDPSPPFVKKLYEVVLCKPS